MKTYLIADTHLNEENIPTYCQRPENYSDLIMANLRRTLTQNDILIHLGDVYIGKKPPYLCNWPGRKILVQGNHDKHHSLTWWMTEGGFDFACESMTFRGHLLTHKPSNRHVLDGCFNIHGHLHNVWDGFVPEGKHPFDLTGHRPWQRLFAVEYTKYSPVEFEKFISHADRYKAIRPVPENGIGAY